MKVTIDWLDGCTKSFVVDRFVSELKQSKLVLTPRTIILVPDVGVRLVTVEDEA